MSVDPGAMGAPIQINPTGTSVGGSTPLPMTTSGAPTSSGSGILPAAKWMVAFVVMAGGLLLVSESPKYQDVAAALAVLIAVGAFTWQYKAMFAEIDKVFGTSLSQQFSPS